MSSKITDITQQSAVRVFILSTHICLQYFSYEKYSEFKSVVLQNIQYIRLHSFAFNKNCNISINFSIT